MSPRTPHRNQPHVAPKLALHLILCAFVVTFCLLGNAQDTDPNANQTSQAPSSSAPAAEPQQAQPQQQNPPDSPGTAKQQKPKRNSTANPVQQIGGVTKETAVKTKDVATAGLLKARDWESNAISGIYVGRNRQLVALTPNQREEIYLKETLTTPSAYVKRMFAAAFDQLRGTPSQWGGGMPGYADRFGSREGQFITANSFAALGNGLLGYEVRYDQCKCSGFWPRTRHAILRNLMTYDQSETERRPQIPLYGGAFVGGLVSTSWKPHPRNAFAEGGRAMAGQLAWGTVLNFITEFSREINRKQGVKR